MEGELAQWLSAYATALGLSVFSFEAKNSRSEAALLRPAAQFFVWQMKEEKKLSDWAYQIHSSKAKKFPHQQIKGLGEKVLRPKAKSNLRRFPLVQLEAIEEEEEGFICWHSQTGMELQAVRCRYLILSKGCPQKYISQFDLLAQAVKGQKEVQQYQTNSKGNKKQRELFLWPNIYSVEDNGKSQCYRFFGQGWSTKEQEQILASPGLKSKKEIAEAYRLKKWRQGRLFALGPLAHHLPAYFGLTSSLFWEEMGNLLWRIAYIQSNYLCEEPLLQAWEEEQQRDWQKVFGIQKELLAGQASLWSRFKQYWRGAKFWEHRLLARKNVLLPNLVLKDAFGRPTHLWSIKQMGFLLLGLDQNPVDLLAPKELALFARLRSQFVGLYSSQLPEQARFAAAYKVSNLAAIGTSGSLVVVDPKGCILVILKSRKKIQAFCRRLEKNYPEAVKKKGELCEEE